MSDTDALLAAITNLRKQISGETIQVAVLKRELDAFEAILRATEPNVLATKNEPIFQCPDCGKDIADVTEPHALDCRMS